MITAFFNSSLQYRIVPFPDFIISSRTIHSLCKDWKSRSMIGMREGNSEIGPNNMGTSTPQAFRRPSFGTTAVDFRVPKPWEVMKPKDGEGDCVTCFWNICNVQIYLRPLSHETGLDSRNKQTKKTKYHSMLGERRRSSIRGFKSRNRKLS